jgi:acyl transferase domain-containing protein
MDQDKMKPVAVVGMVCRYPGDASSPEAFFKMLAEGRSAWSEVPKDRYNIESYYHPSKDRMGATRSRGAHWMKEDVSVFDAPVWEF